MEPEVSMQGLGLSGDPPIPLKPKIKIKDYEEVQVAQSINIAAQGQAAILEKHKVTLYK